jgi:hypothetical protein
MKKIFDTTEQHPVLGLVHRTVHVTLVLKELARRGIGCTADSTYSALTCQAKLADSDTWTGMTLRSCCTPCLLALTVGMQTQKESNL